MNDKKEEQEQVKQKRTKQIDGSKLLKYRVSAEKDAKEDVKEDAKEDTADFIDEFKEDINNDIANDNELTERVFYNVENSNKLRKSKRDITDFEPVIFEASLEDYPPANEFITSLKDFIKTSKIRPFVAPHVLIGIKYNLLIPINKILRCPTSLQLSFKTIIKDEELINCLQMIITITYRGGWKWSVDDLMKIDLIISLASIYVSGLKQNTDSHIPNYGEQLRLIGATEAVISASRFIDQ